MSKRDETRQLTLELMRHLHGCGYFCASEIPLVVSGAYSAEQRADVYAIKLHEFARKDTRIYEVKVTRPDFLRDVDTGKAESYGEHARRVFYCVPQGLVKKSEVPDGVGLIVNYPTGFKVLQAPKPQQIVEPSVDLMLLLMARWGSIDYPQVRALSDRIRVEDNVALAERAKSIGYDIARKLRGDGRPSERERVAAELLSMVESALGESAFVSTSQSRFGHDLSLVWEIESLARLATGMLEEAARVRKVGDYLRLVGDAWSDGRLRKLVKEVDRALPKRV